MEDPPEVAFLREKLLEFDRLNSILGGNDYLRRFIHSNDILEEMYPDKIRELDEAFEEFLNQRMKEIADDLSHYHKMHLKIKEMNEGNKKTAEVIHELSMENARLRGLLNEQEH